VPARAEQGRFGGGACSAGALGVWERGRTVAGSVLASGQKRRLAAIVRHGTQAPAAAGRAWGREASSRGREKGEGHSAAGLVATRMTAQQHRRVPSCLASSCPKARGTHHAKRRVRRRSGEPEIH
jgi:hypothetical protein